MKRPHTVSLLLGWVVFFFMIAIITRLLSKDAKTSELIKGSTTGLANLFKGTIRG